MEKTLRDFEALTDKFWTEDAYKYGSMQFPAAKARDVMTQEGVTNARELYEEFRQRQGRNFYYAGD